MPSSTWTNRSGHDLAQLSSVCEITACKDSRADLKMSGQWFLPPRTENEWFRAHLIDERLSSIAAKALTGSERIDDIAAALILESWLGDHAE